MGVSLNGEPSADKLRGGYYTPSALADWLAAWAVPTGTELVLEPSAGDGTFVSAVSRRLRAGGLIRAVELSAGEAKKVERLNSTLTEVINQEAFDWWWQCGGQGISAYDAVVGNPPFIRYQHFPESHRQAAFAMMRSEGLSPTRLTNAWVPFVVLATAALRPGGRLAMVLPAEVLQVGYANELRSYLAREYKHISLITFRRLVFEGILQETVLLLGLRGHGDLATITTFEVENVEDLPRPDQVMAAARKTLPLDHAREKWTQYFLTADELALLRECEQAPALVQLGDLADVDVGVVTGRNEFFVLTPEAADALGLPSECRRLVSRSAHLSGVQLSEIDWRHLERANARVLLLDVGDRPLDEVDPAVRSYLQAGEGARMHTGYKCRIRMPHWWKLPNAWAPDAFLLRQIYDGPRIVRNGAGATATDTLHRVRCHRGVDADELAAVSVNSLTWAFAEVRGRSYGGGVLELEPREAEALPYPRLTAAVSVDDVNALVRAAGVEAAMDEVDRLVLKVAGLSDGEISMLRGIWTKLAARRRSRSKGSGGRLFGDAGVSVRR